MAENSRNKSPETNYFDLDEILASASKVTCSIEADVPPEFLAFIGQPGEKYPSEDGVVGGSRRRGGRANRERKVDIPLWLAEAITKANPDFIRNVELSRCYKTNQRHSLEACPVNADLKKSGPYFYAFGQRLSKLCPKSDGKQLATTLLQAFSSRLAWIMGQTQAGNENQKPSTLDKNEEKLFGAGLESEIDFAEWHYSVSKRKRSSGSLKRSYDHIS